MPMDIPPSGLSGSLIGSWLYIQGVSLESRVECPGPSSARRGSRKGAEMVQPKTEAEEQG